MLKISFFVDFSNLLGSLSKINVKVSDYETFFLYLAKRASTSLKVCALTDGYTSPIMLNRVYWYAVGAGDQYDFGDSKTKKFFSDLFNSNREIKSAFMASAGKENPTLSQDELAQKSLDAFIADRELWYNDRKKKISGFCDFYDIIQRQCDFISISPCGYWKMDFISKTVDEKGIDTALAVDSVTMSDTFDITIILSGDADMIPSVNYLKRQGKYVGVMSFIAGYPPEKKGRQQSRRLSRAADFDTQIYEMDLIRDKIAEKRKKDDIDI